MKYEGQAIVPSGADSAEITFAVPDMISGAVCIARDRNDNFLPSVYDSVTKKITVKFPEGRTQFTLTVADPCIIDCFFPPTATTIDTTFLFSTGGNEHLGHDLSIESPDGHLMIEGGSKMYICENYTLANRNKISMVGYYDPAYGQPFYKTCGVDNEPGKEYPHTYARGASDRSVIIVQDKAALVLESGSETLLGANSSIIVRDGGTLLVKSGATVEVGGAQQPGYAEIIAEPGSYVCIEPGADIHFKINTHDTTDKNVVYFSSRNGGINAGTNPLGAKGKFLPDSIYAMNQCLLPCSLNTMNVHGAIANPKYGWSNINKPFAHFIVRDTFCYGDTITVNALGTLNETRFRFEVCQWDTAADACVPPTTMVPSLWDTGVVKECRITGKLPIIAQHNYRIRMVVQNDCGVEDDTSRIIYVIMPPAVELSVPDTACPGYQTVSADGTGSGQGRGHIWTVTQIPDIEPLEDDTLNEPAEMSYELTGPVSSNFTFPGYRFRGGYGYIISLKVLERCGDNTKSDTVWIPLRARIIPSDSITIYRDSAGPDSVVLHAQLYNALTWSWSSIPSSTLPQTQSITVKPVQTTRYILTATGANSCTESDTIIVKVNQYAHAGKDTVICLGDSVQLGFQNSSLPTGFDYRWSPDSSLNDSTADRPWAKPMVSTYYRVRVIDGTATMETDGIWVYVDSIPAPAYGVSIDRSPSALKLCFDNFTEPVHPKTRFTWNFGDGGATTDTNYMPMPCHTFPDLAKDTFYWVSLTVHTACGDSTFTDSVFVPAHGIPDTSGTNSIQVVTSIKEDLRHLPGNQTGSGQESAKLLGNIPNPFTNITRILYLLPIDIGKARIEIRDIIGREVAILPLQAESKEAIFNCGSCPAGLYYYTLIVDGRPVGTQKMVIQR